MKKILKITDTILYVITCIGVGLIIGEVRNQYKKGGAV